MRSRFAAIAIGVAAASLVWLWPVHAQQNGCRTAPLDHQAITNYCASEAFVSRHFPSGPVTPGHVAVFTDSSGQTLDDGGPSSSVSITAGQGIAVSPDPLTGTGTVSTGPGVDTNHGRTVTGAPSITSGDCGDPVFLSGNALYTVVVGAASGFPADCKLIFSNTDVYSGPGTGRGKIMDINGITKHPLWPQQTLVLRRNSAGSAWVPDQQINGSFGQFWFLASAPVFFSDNGGDDNNHDGLAAGASDAFEHLSRCIDMVGQAQVTRNGSTTFCKHTAGQSITAFVNILYYNQAPIPFQIQSTVNGSQFTWNCPSGQVCIQFGDYGGVQLQDVAFVMNNNAIITGHQYGVVDIFTNVSFQGNSASFPALTCDYDSHYNIVNGLTYSGTMQLLFNFCPGSTWNINSTLTASGTPTLGRFFNQTSTARTVFQGNVTFTGALSVSVGLISGNATMNNLSGSAPPGGAPTPTTGGQYCTSPC